LFLSPKIEKFILTIYDLLIQFFKVTTGRPFNCLIKLDFKTKYGDFTDGSLIPGHHQDCPVDDAHGGWLQCLDLTEEIVGSFGCPEENYGIHRNNVWVQNGCHIKHLNLSIP
jgi:hypothetical protein